MVCAVEPRATVPPWQKPHSCGAMPRASGPPPPSRPLIDATAELAPTREQAGMVTDARFADFDGDGRLDLLVAARWQPLRLLRFNGDAFVDATDAAGLAGLCDFWVSNCSPEPGGAMLVGGEWLCPTTGIVGCVLAQVLVAEVCEALAARGLEHTPHFLKGRTGWAAASTTRPPRPRSKREGTSHVSLNAGELARVDTVSLCRSAAHWRCCVRSC